MGPLLNSPFVASPEAAVGMRQSRRPESHPDGGNRSRRPTSAGSWTARQIIEAIRAKQIASM